MAVAAKANLVSNSRKRKKKLLPISISFFDRFRVATKNLMMKGPERQKRHNYAMALCLTMTVQTL